MGKVTKNDLFRDYYFNNKGTLYKSFDININNFHHSYDIYWGNPDIIFNNDGYTIYHPLAVTQIPQRKNYPNPRIFLHEKFDKKNTSVFEMVVAHEIGHLWLHDIVGLSNPNCDYCISEDKAETWADYFAYCFFVKYRNIDCLVNFNEIQLKAVELQIEIYNADPEQQYKLANANIENLKILKQHINSAISNGDQVISQILEAIEITLTSLGNIFS